MRDVPGIFDQKLFRERDLSKIADLKIDVSEEAIDVSYTYTDASP